MTSTWIKQYLTFDAFGDVVLEDLGHGLISVPELVLINFFGSVIPFTHANLSATPQSKAGWQQYFDEWKAKGFIA